MYRVHVPKFQAHADDADDVRDLLARHKELSHLRVRRRADCLILESGPEDDPVRHARFRRVTVGLWILDAATHDGRWESTLHRALLPKLVETLLNEFPWLVSEAG